jgi:N-formylglutamate amidohydrolase
MCNAVTGVFYDSNVFARGAIVVSVPHAGRDYPPEILDLLALPIETVRPLEDRLADLVAGDAVDRGYRVFVARTPRLMIDLNRAETDFDPLIIAGASGRSARPSPRARGGLGLIPDRLSGLGKLWKKPVTTPELAARLAMFHRPYHEALDRALTLSCARHGAALLVDLHSMPPLSGRHAADVVIGDRLGRSAAPTIVDAARDFLSAHGLRVAVNVPYAGGYIVERHSDPRQGRHAIQLEIDRRLYLDPLLADAGAGLAPMQRLFADLIAVLEPLVRQEPFSIAAE